MPDFTLLQQQYAERVNQVLSTTLSCMPFQDNALLQAMHYSLLLGGKRFRPSLVYATGSLFGTPLTTLDIPAAAIECIHAYSLIHDDLPAMDNDDLRRGQPTTHVKYGQAIAILAGDALQSLAFSILSDSRMPNVTTDARLKMISILATASGAQGMCIGQSFDLQSENQQITLEKLESIHRHKTGALIVAATQIALLTASSLPDSASTLFERYAQILGLSFQIQDDLLDITGNTNTIGKRQGKDLQQNKSTYPAILGLEASHLKITQLKSEALEILAQLEQFSYDVTQLRLLTHFVVDRNR